MTDKTMEPVRLGVIGCGVIGTGAHLPDAAKSSWVKVVAVADLIPERVRQAATQFSIAAAYATGNELIDDPTVEAVVLALPTGVRTPLALRALARGKHVLLEKPAARNLGEIHQLMAARGDRVVACCSPRYQVLSSARAAAACVASGALGELRVVRVRAVLAAGKAPGSPPPPWRVSHELNGGGILVNWGCYDLDYLLGITGWQLKPERVFAQTWPLAEHLRSRVDPCSDAENHVVALIRCQGGVIINYERGEFVSAANDEAWQILGSRGSLRLHMRTGKSKEILLDKSDAAAGVSSEAIWRGDDDTDPMTQAIHEDFARAIREKRVPITPLEHSLVLQQITDAIYASARQGREVVIDH